MAPLVVAREQRHLARALRTDADAEVPEIRTGQCEHLLDDGPDA